MNMFICVIIFLSLFFYICWLWDFGVDFLDIDFVLLFMLFGVIGEYGMLGKVVWSVVIFYWMVWGLMQCGEVLFGKMLVIKVCG